MHRLLLIRHAKTEQGDVDRTRQLTGRGRRDATAIGDWLTANDAIPDLVLISPATRARQTWDLAATQLLKPPPTLIEHGIYSNGIKDLLGIVRDVDESVQAVALVGHNPSIEDFTAEFGGDVDSVPTGSVVAFDIDGAWADGKIRFAGLATCRG